VESVLKKKRKVTVGRIRFTETSEQKFSLEEFRVRRFAVIQEEIRSRAP